jgi:16S rRNA C967 or C1407 C5-methylase (RsmB/RsmF family)
LQAFRAHYSAIWGERWAELERALVAEDFKTAWRNPFPGLKPEYFLDPASILVAHALGVKPGDSVLDLCAAPGGKTLVLSESLAEAGELTANERSADRRARLKRVLEEYLPESLRARVRVTGHDATRWGLHERDRYDRVLLDAPCSSEAHVLRDPKALAQWSPKRSERLAIQAYAMLASALTALKPGGTLVYSTCSVARAENDSVIEKLLHRRGEEFKIDSLISITQGEPTVHGWEILPDRDGAGPMYLTRIVKNRP